MWLYCSPTGGAPPWGIMIQVCSSESRLGHGPFFGQESGVEMGGGGHFWSEVLRARVLSKGSHLLASMITKALVQLESLSA